MTDAQYNGLIAAIAAAQASTDAATIAGQVCADLLWMCAGLLLALLVVQVASLAAAVR